MAKKAKRIIGAEIVPEAVLDAKRNALENGIENACLLYTSRLRLRKAPELKFAADDSVEHGMEIFRKIEALKKDDEEDKCGRSGRNSQK